MSFTHQPSRSIPSTRPSTRLATGLTILVICILGGMVFGVVQLQRIEQEYRHGRSSRADSQQVSGPIVSAAPIAIIGNPKHGKELFNMSCYVCHGPSGAGVPSLGVTLRQSRFVATRTDQQLIAFIKIGRQPGEPNSVQNGTMPPRGGNPMLDDAGLQDVVAFIRLLQRDERMGTAAAAQQLTSAVSTVVGK